MSMLNVSEFQEVQFDDGLRPATFGHLSSLNSPPTTQHDKRKRDIELKSRTSQSKNKDDSEIDAYILGIDSEKPKNDIREKTNKPNNKLHTNVDMKAKDPSGSSKDPSGPSKDPSGPSKDPSGSSKDPIGDSISATEHFDNAHDNTISVSSPHHAEDKALFTINISNVIGPEYVPFFTDVARMLCIHLTIQFMYYIGSDNVAFFSSEFIVMILYVILGVMIFWLIVRKIVHLS